LDSPASSNVTEAVLYKGEESMSLLEFERQFHFKRALAGNVGVEREQFLQSKKGKIVPYAARVLGVYEKKGIPQHLTEPYRFGPGEREYITYLAARPDEFGYELSACQIESRTGPSKMRALKCKLTETDARLRLLLQHFNLTPLYAEVGPKDMSLEVYPDPTGRYQRITKNMPCNVLLAACRVIGTHVHVGMPDHKTALRVYNHAIQHLHELCELGNGSFGERLAIYRQMASKYLPQPYASWQEYYETACAEGFEEDPRKCWTLIRISVHGTIEFRMFGATDSIPRIVRWAARCHELCTEAFVSA
jgi:hypothetical protein